MTDLEKRTSLNQAGNKFPLTAGTAYRFVGSFISTQILLWEIEMTQQINKPDVFSFFFPLISKAITMTARLLVWLKHGSKISLQSKHVKQKE